MCSIDIKKSAFKNFLVKARSLCLLASKLSRNCLQNFDTGTSQMDLRNKHRAENCHRVVGHVKSFLLGPTAAGRIYIWQRRCFLTSNPLVGMSSSM
jgi:hypothetical protein